MKRKFFLVFAFLLCGITFFYAKVGDKMYVNVKETVLKSGTGFFSSSVGKLNYGVRVEIIEEKGKWVFVESLQEPYISGWMPISSLTKKKIVMNEGLFSVDASAEELALAGKGFSAEVEQIYMESGLSSAYDLVDTMEAETLTTEEMYSFVVEGQLRGGEE